MALLAALVIALLGWAIWKRKLSAVQLPPLLLAVAGAFLAVRGNFLIGLGALAVGLLWFQGQRFRLKRSAPLNDNRDAIDQARFLLGVSRFDNADYIVERHRELVTHIESDGSGGEQRRQELNRARDLLLRDLRDRAR